MPEKLSWTPDELTPAFWKTIDSVEGDPGKFEALAKRMSREEIYEFYRQYELARIAFHDSRYLKSGMSDDDIDDIAMWIIAQGEQAYRRIHAHPEELPDDLPSDEPIGLNSIASEVAEDRFGQDLFDLFYGKS